MSIAGYPHIEQRENGKLYVAGTPYKVVMLIADHVYWKLNAEQIAAQHAGLSLAASYGVLAYFYDNETAVRSELEERQRLADELRALAGPQPSKRDLLARLQAEVAAEVAH